MGTQCVVLFIWRLSVLGGMQQHVVQLALALKSAGWSPTVATIVADEADETYFGPLRRAAIPVLTPRAATTAERALRRVLRTPSPRHPALTRLIGQIEALEPDLVHVHGYLGQEATVVAQFVRAGMAVAYTDHGNLADLPAETALERARTLACAHALSAVSARGGRALTRSVAEATGQQREVALLHHVLDVPAAPGDVQPVADRSTRVLMVASLKRFKGHDVLFAALRELTARGVRIEATLVGDGPDREIIEFECEELRGAGTVAFTGQVPHARVGSYIAAADIAVLPSRSESMPIAILEYMAHSRAIVATPTGGVPEILADGENALIVPIDDATALADAIARLAGDPALRRRLGAAARATFERITPSVDAVLNEVLAVYRAGQHARAQERAR